MPITSTAPVAAASQGNQAAAPASPFNGDAFMKLLLTQLKHQDPLNPMKDQEFMAQLAQMNTLAEVQKLNANVEALSRAQTLSQAASLIGKVVQAVSGGRTVQGTVASVRVNGPEVLLDLGSAVIQLAEVRVVSEARYAAA
mgnify:FL=1